MSHQVREVFLSPAEVQDAGDKDHEGDHRRDGEADVVHRDVPEEDGPMRVDQAGQGVEGEDPLQVPAEDVGRVDHRRDKHQELDEEGEGELHVPILHADGREPVTRPCRQEEGEENDHRQEEDRHRRHELVVDHHRCEDDHGDQVIHDA